MSFLQRFPKLKDSFKVKLADTKPAFFIDNSGSTSTFLAKKPILQHELDFIKLFGSFNPEKSILWNHAATKIITYETVCATGCTEPSCIFDNVTSRLIFDNNQVIFFMTDGEISSTEVTKFTKALENKLDKDLIVCILFKNSSLTETDTNISVFAPFLIAKNLLILQTNGETIKVLHTNGNILLTKNMIVTTTDLLGVYVENNYPKIPEGFNVLNETDSDVMAFNMDFLLKEKSFEKKNLTLEDWDKIIRLSKMKGNLEELRSRVNHFRNSSIGDMVTTLKAGIYMPITDKKNKLIENIMMMKEKAVDNKDDEKKLVAELQEIIPKGRIEEADVAKKINGELHEVRSYWDGVRNLFFHYETASYTLDDMTGIANRAKRAVNITMEDDLCVAIEQENVPKIQCILHLDLGPAVIWLDKPADPESALGDHVLTFPLDYFKDLSKCIKSNPVCGDCAAGYFHYSNGLTVFKEPIMGFIPVDVKNNKRFIKKQLCRILCNSKLLSHVEMLLLSVLDDCKHAWFDNNVKDYIIDQLANNIYTTDSFSEEGKRVTFREAVLGLNCEKVLRQPIIAAFRMLTFLSKYDSKQKENIFILVKERLAFKLVEIAMSTLLHEGKDVMIGRINDALYTTFCGLPCVDNFDVKMPKFEEMVKTLNNSEKIVQLVERLCKVFGSSCDKLFPCQYIGQVMCSLRSITEHERPSTVYQKLAKNELFSKAFSVGAKDAVLNIKNDLVGNYFKANRLFVPPYVHYMGIDSTPTKLFFGNKRLLGDDETKFSSLKDLANTLQLKLAYKLKTSYGSTYPDATSAHVSMHKIVAFVMEAKYPKVTEPTDEVYLTCINELKKTNGKRGNIYSYNCLSAMIYCIHDFCRIRNASDKTRAELGRNYCDFLTRVTAELKLYGFTDFIDYSKLNAPVCIRETYKNIDVDTILTRLNMTHKAMVSTDKSDDQKCLDIAFDEVFKIDVPEAEQNLEKWKKEQESFLKEIVLEDSAGGKNIKLVAGMDISFDKNNDKRAVASMVIYQYPSLKKVCQASLRCSTNIKYMAGFLAFREVPILMKLFSLVKERGIVPDLILMDGNGVWHPRSCGVASHFSVFTGVPCIGVAKKVLVVEDINEDKVLELMKDSVEGETREVKTASGMLLGVAYNITGSHKNSTFISVGSGISLESGVKIVKNVSLHRVSEPIRQADLLSRQLLDTWV